MPPKAKFTKEEIIAAALTIVQSEGESGLTARTLGTKLGSSPRPIFTVFQSMEEVQLAVKDAAKNIYKEYVARGLAEELPFKGVGVQYILFAVKEPKLFHLLFMREQWNVPDFSGILPMIDENYDKILGSIMKGYDMDADAALRLYQHLWIYTHGIATLCATKMCKFNKEQIGQMTTEVFASLIKNRKAGNEND